MEETDGENLASDGRAERRREGKRRAGLQRREERMRKLGCRAGAVRTDEGDARQAVYRAVALECPPHGDGGPGGARGRCPAGPERTPDLDESVEQCRLRRPVPAPDRNSEREA